MKKAILWLIVIGLAGLAWAADPLIGTWKMNPAKSKYSYATPKSYTITFSAQDDGIKAVEDEVDAEGKAVHRTWFVKYDGKDYAITAPDVDTIAVRKLDAYTVEYVVKKKGKEAWSGRAVISKDGKTRTNKGGGKDEKGQPFTYTLFLEKQ